MPKAIVIVPKKAPVVMAITDFNELKAIIDGYLQAIAFTSDTMAYMDEEGKVRADKVPALNRLATHLCNTVGTPLFATDWIAGTMVIMGKFNDQGEMDGEDHDVPAHVIKVVMEASQEYAKSQSITWID